MGNQLAQPARLQPEVLADLQGVVYKETLGACIVGGMSASCCRATHSCRCLQTNTPGGGRFLKTLLCVHDDGGLVVVKVRWCTYTWLVPHRLAQVYHKREDTPDLRAYHEQLHRIKCVFVINSVPMQLACCTRSSSQHHVHQVVASGGPVWSRVALSIVFRERQGRLLGATVCVFQPPSAPEHAPVSARH